MVYLNTASVPIDPGGDRYPYIVSGSMLSQFLECERLPYMNLFADPAEAVRRTHVDLGFPDEVREAIRSHARERAHQRRSPPAITSDGEDVDCGPPLRWTRTQMAKGKEKIEYGVLNAVHWWGSPQLMNRVEGSSALGAWHYEPAVTRYAAKLSFKRLALRLTYYALLLEKVQGVRPRRFSSFSVYDGETRQHEVAPHVGPTAEALERLEAMLSRGRDPGPNIKDACNNCQWNRSCMQRAQQVGHLTLLTGVRARQARELTKAGIQSCEELAVASPERVGAALGAGAEVAQLAIARARVHQTRIAEVLGKPWLPAPAEVEAYLDFEALSDTHEPFLSWLLVRDRRGDRYRSFLARSVRDIPNARAKLVAALDRLPKDALIFHYGPFDRTVLRKAPEFRDGHRDDLLDRLTDVLAVVKRHAAIPAKSLSLKELARQLGIELPEGVGGQWAPHYWQAWVQSRKPSLRDKLLSYGRGDVQGLVTIVDWLRGQYAPPPPASPLAPIKAGPRGSQGRPGRQ